MGAAAQEGLIPAYGWLESLSDDELADLDFVAAGAERELEESQGRHIVEAGKRDSPKLDALKGEHASAVLGLVGQLENDDITKPEFLRRMHDLLVANFRAAYELKRGKELDEGDEEWLRRAVAEEMKHARGFGSDVENEAGAMPYAERAQMWGDTLGGIATHAEVESLPDDVRIHWRLGKAEHCEDCLILSCVLTDSMLIDTFRGRVPLREVRMGDMSLTHLGRWRKVLAKPIRFSDGSHRMAVLVTRDGLVGFTDDHRMWTRRGWMLARKVSNESERCLPGLRDEDRPSKVNKQALALLSRLLSEVALAGDSEIQDPAVRILQEEFQSGRIPDQEFEVGQVLLLPGMLPRGSPLFDLSVEEDCSFIGGGLALHNSNSPYTKWDLPTTPRAGSTRCLSNCKCKLEYEFGKLEPEERVDVQRYDFRKDESLTDLMKIPDPPDGMRHPDAEEQRYIDSLRNRINYARRRIADTSLTDDDIEEAIRERKEANEELVEFLERNGIYEVPTWSVDDVLDGRHVGRRAVQDIMRHGLDGRSLDMVGKKRLGALLSRYEDQVGETLADDMLADKVRKEKG